ncbi:MAG: hypothetical protein NVSMB19_18290 [Vulcanimicrobiaceae bacterium]
MDELTAPRGSRQGVAPHHNVAIEPHDRVPFAETIRAEAGIATGAVALTTDRVAAAGGVRAERADLVLLARNLLREPYRSLHAASALA